MASYAEAPAVHRNPLRRVETWLDERGRIGWIAATVLAFFFVWPVGLALVGYMMWQNKFGLRSQVERKLRGTKMQQSPTGNAAFDAYRADTLRRLEEEQAAFEEFLERLREARDKAEFDQFMEDRGRHSDLSKNADPA